MILVEQNGTVSDFPYADFGVSLIRNCCGLVNGSFSEGEFGWENRNEGPGVDAGVEEIIAVGDREHVLRLDSRAGANYYLGGGKLKLSGSYDMYDKDDILATLTNQPLSATLQNARLDYSGLEIILGVEIEL